MGYLERLRPFLEAIGHVHDGVITEPDTYYDFVEVFSGMESVSNGLRAFGMVGVSIDKKHRDLENFLTPPGFLYCLTAVMRLKAGGLLFLAPPCSTWVFFSCSSTGRRTDAPMGAGTMLVKTQNRLVSRLCHVMWLAQKRGAFVMLEQPASSVMPGHPRFAKLYRKFNFRTTHLDMGSYGGFSQKPSKLFGTAPWQASLEKKSDAWDKMCMKQLPGNDTVSKMSINERGKKCYTAGSGCKATQSYPVGFGQANALLMDTYRRTHATSSAIASEDIDLQSDPSEYDSDLDMFADFQEGNETCWSQWVKDEVIPEPLE